MKKRRFLNFPVIFSMLISFLMVQPVHAAAILRASEGGIDSGTCGAAWDTTCSLRHALALAANGDQIWVARGSHTAITDSDLSATFQLKNGVAIYGGFAGGETNLDQRDWQANMTILEGFSPGYVYEAYHVVTASGTNASAILDGFIIQDGNASGTANPGGYGGGILNISGSPTLANLKIGSNNAMLGAGMYNENSSPTLKNVTFVGNGGGYSCCQRSGGGMYNKSSSPTLMGVFFDGNSADLVGGGMDNVTGSSPVLTNVVFRGNSAKRGGGMYNSGSSPTLINVTFNGNQSAEGGAGIYNALNSGPVIYNTILWGDSAGEVLNEAGSIPILHYILVQGGCPAAALCDHLLAQDPQFIQLPGGGNAGDFRLKLNSPAIDAGDNTILPPGATVDLNGAPRFVDNPFIPNSGNGAPPVVDLGAYEAQQPVFYVKNGGAGSDCASWTLACSDLQAALARTGYPGQEIWIAAGPYKPTAGTDRSATFQLKNGVAIYGGFAGTESSRSQRNWESNSTILSGDIGIEGNTSDNSYHVVTGISIDSTARLDGVTVSGGNANGSTFETAGGGGMFVKNGSPVVTNVIFSANYGNSGGGVYDAGGQTVLTLDNVVFSGNTAGSGGGLCVFGSNPALTNLTFLNNSAGSGGGMTLHFYSSPTIVNAFFSGNKATGVNGAGGGLLISGTSNPTVVNAVFIGNSADMGGGIAFDGAGSSGALINLSFFNNTAITNYGGAIRYIDTNAFPSPPSIYNSILWGDHGGELNDPMGFSSLNLHYNFIQGVPNDEANHVWGDRDPLYVDAAGGNLRLPVNSPAIDAGDDSAIPVGITIDLDHNMRKQNYPGVGTDLSHTVDLGAYELTLPLHFFVPLVSK